MSGPPPALPLALSDLFLTPLGLAALAALVPLVLLYLVRPEPQRVRLPTLRFLSDADLGGTDSPALERLRRNLLLFVQALVVVLLALALAGPYVTVPRTATVEETVLVVDTSASMQTTDVGASRLAAARQTALDAVASTTTVVTAAPSPRVRLRQGSAREARATLSGLSATDTGGDLAGAVTQAAAVAPTDVRIVVISDFAGDDWRRAVESARARGYEVRLDQVGGRVANVGIVDVSYGRTELTATVQNYGDEPAHRTLRLGDRSRTLDLGPGDVATATFPVPTGDAELRLAGRDAFALDDTAYVSGPDEAQIDVLLLTNDENRYLRTALGVLDEVNVTVDHPPTTVTREYDVYVFSNVAPERVLNGTLGAARDRARNGGGVIVQSQRDVRAVGYGSLLLLSPDRVRTAPAVQVRPDPLTDGIAFPPPNEYVAGSLASGRAVVTADGSPLVATGSLGQGHLLYYGYIEDASSFKYNYQYPVFWKRAVYYAAGRSSLASTNYRTGESIRLDGDRTVRGPNGTSQQSTLAFDRAGFYRVGDRRLSASLLDGAESNVSAPPLAARGADAGASVERDQRVPRPLAPLVALAAVVIVLAELLVLRRRGDL
ncbi:MAG: VWA domain-containing protein [Haloarculaceae archaeon]